MLYSPFISNDSNDNFEIVLTEKEVQILWKWLRIQSLPYDNYELKDLVHQLGILVEPKL
jgi:hypothetical protein